MTADTSEKCRGICEMPVVALIHWDPPAFCLHSGANRSTSSLSIMHIAI
jgi:hypothetical protein